MTSVWLVVEATFPGLQARDITISFVKPIVDTFQDKLVSFHFFFEPHLLFRAKADEAVVANEIVPFVKRKLSDLGIADPSVRVDPNYSEQADYGDGWEIAQKLFEMGSRSAILKASSDAGIAAIGLQFNEGKFMHLLLNQWGHSIREEALVHLDRVGERLAILHSGGNMRLAQRTLPHIVEQILRTYFPQIDNFVGREMAQSRTVA